jgi:hypothetical protein
LALLLLADAFTLIQLVARHQVVVVAVLVKKKYIYLPPMF